MLTFSPLWSTATHLPAALHNTSHKLHCIRSLGSNGTCQALPASVICRMTNTLRELQVKPTMEEVSEAEAPNVDDYLRNVHEASILAAIHVSAGMATTVLAIEPTSLLLSMQVLPDWSALCAGHQLS